MAGKPGPLDAGFRVGLSDGGLCPMTAETGTVGYLTWLSGVRFGDSCTGESPSTGGGISSISSPSSSKSVSEPEV